MFCPFDIPLIPRTHVVSPFKTCGGPGTLYRKVEHLLFAVPIVIAAAWVIMIFFVRELYSEFGYANGILFWNLKLSVT
jgi:hypothetical protein